MFDLSNKVRGSNGRYCVKITITYIKSLIFPVFYINRQLSAVARAVLYLNDVIALKFRSKKQVS